LRGFGYLTVVFEFRNYIIKIIDFQTSHAKLRSQDGNSRKQLIKVPNRLLSEIKDVSETDTAGK
jgi:hypothetical protein